MVDYQTMKNCIDRVVEQWGEEIAVAAIVAPNKQAIGLREYLKTYCTMCGGNWGAWFLTGIKELFPQIYEMIPDTMGPDGNTAFGTIFALITILGIDVEN